MREFKEFPCTVYQLTQTNKVRKVVVTGPVSTYTKALGATSRGHVRAEDCHKSFAAAVESGKKSLTRKLLRLNKAVEEVNLDMISLDQQMNLHLNPTKKAKK